MSHDNVWERLLEQHVFQLLPENRQRIGWRDRSYPFAILRQLPSITGVLFISKSTILFLYSANAHTHTHNLNGCCSDGHGLAVQWLLCIFFFSICS